MDDDGTCFEQVVSKWGPNGWVIEICEPNFKFDPNLKIDMLFGCCNAFQTMVNLLVLTWSSIRALLRSKLTFMKNVLKKSSKGRVNGLISKQGFFRPCLNQPNNLPTHLFHIYRLCEVVFSFFDFFFEFFMLIWMRRSLRCQDALIFVWMYVDLVYQLESLVYDIIRLWALVFHFFCFFFWNFYAHFNFG